MHMIRRKMWATCATATFCLAVAGATQAQTPIRYVPRGGYVAPTPPGYAAPTPNLTTTTPAPLTAEPLPPQAPMPGPMPVTTVPADDTVMFAADTVQTAPAPGGTAPMVPMSPMTPGGPATIPVMPRVIPGTPMPAAPGAMTPMPMGSVVTGPVMMEGGVPTGPMVNGAIGGGPMTEFSGSAPYLDGGYAGASPKLWLTGEYIDWRFRGAHVPPLVTTGPAGSGGTLGEPGVAVVYGGHDHESEWRPGFRVRGGTWLDNGAGLDLGFFYLRPTKTSFVMGSNGDPGIYRPFFNTATGAEDAALVAFVDPTLGPIVRGTATVLTNTQLYGGEANYRAGWNTGLGGRFDSLVGLRYARLDDKLTITSDVTTEIAAGAAPAGTAITVIDKFHTLNQFYGGQVGLVGEWQMGNMTFGLRGTVAAGANTQRVEIDGSSVASAPGFGPIRSAGGVLALPSNSGTHDRTVFSLLSEAGATVGYQVGEHLRVFGGYNVMSWTNAARAGEQINRHVNGTFIPDPTTGTAAGSGFPNPTFNHHESSFWVHGWTGGVEWRW
jgi:hypothetical protein